MLDKKIFYFGSTICTWLDFVLLILQTSILYHVKMSITCSFSNGLWTVFYPDLLEGEIQSRPQPLPPPKNQGLAQTFALIYFSSPPAKSIPPPQRSGVWIEHWFVEAFKISCLLWYWTLAVFYPGCLSSSQWPIHLSKTTSVCPLLGSVCFL